MDKSINIYCLHYPKSEYDWNNISKVHRTAEWITDIEEELRAILSDDKSDSSNYQKEVLFIWLNHVNNEVE